MQKDIEIVAILNSASLFTMTTFKSDFYEFEMCRIPPAPLTPGLSWEAPSNKPKGFPVLLYLTIVLVGCSYFEEHHL